MAGVVIAALLALDGCSLVAPAAIAVDPLEQTQRLVREGRHAEAARGFAELAASHPDNRDYFNLQSADQWIAAGQVKAANTALAAVSADARTRLPVLRTLVGAELAVAENDGTRALHELDQIGVPAQKEEAAAYWWVRGKAAFIAGRPADGVRAYVEREHNLVDPASVRANREDLYGRVQAAAEHGNSLKVPAKSDATVTGWLELGPIAAQLSQDPTRGAAALANWRRKYPLHPGNDSLPGSPSKSVRAPIATGFPDQIALLLPLSGRSESVGVAVRDGFMSAYLQQELNARPRVRIYDVAAQPVGSAYSQAIEDGASFIVGPLNKEDVAQLVPLAAGRTAVLALNFLGEPGSAGNNFYQFALAPEDEARIVARRIVADGRANGIAIVADGEWGTRVSAAFAEELKSLGGTVLVTARYEPSRADFSDIIRQSLQVHGVKGEASTHRADAQFVFVAGAPSAARLILPQLKFHYAGDVPVYATSESYEPAASANNDIDGMMFPDMPWMIAGDLATQQLHDTVHAAWPGRTERRDRLYAFGFDAFRLVPTLRARSAGPIAPLDGVTGKLRLDASNHIRRDLEWAQIRNGAPVGL